jgi:hypothetical protein
MRNLNDYNQENFKNKFSNSPIAKAIANDFEMIVWDKHFDETSIATFRQLIGTKIFSMSSWYYIQYLLDKNPSVIHDIGCGWNIHKKYLDCIVGLSPDDSSQGTFGQEQDYFDEDFVTYRAGQFESAMSICALNYRPLSEIREIVEQFISVVQKGGRGYIALDLKPMVDREEPSVLDKIFGTTTPIDPEIEDYVRDKLNDLPCNVLVFDLDSPEISDGLDGHLRIVFEREA